jgi:hypothetical protein
MFQKELYNFESFIQRAYEVLRTAAEFYLA